MSEHSHSMPHFRGEHTPDTSMVHNPGIMHEEDDVDTRAIYKFTIWLLVGIVLTGVMCYAMYWFVLGRVKESDERRSPLARSAEQRIPPEPRLQLAPGHPQHPLAEMATLRHEQDSIRTNYNWIDQTNGVAQIPIERAKQIIAARATPVSASVTDTGAVQTSNVLRDGENGLAMPSSSSAGRAMEWRDR